MADIIKLLPDSVANQIAAGEVIQRPASIVKELVENSVDAGAKTINVIIKDSGRTLVQIIDDGSGMSETDARLSFERHATSKITSAQDLFAIRTKGFRGEALASIAAVAMVELKTRKNDSEIGTLIQINASKVETQEPCSCPVGSSFSVKNLFYNIPARRKFLKSDNTEMRHIVNEFQKIVLAHPEIRFSLYHNDNEVYNLPEGNLRQRIVNVFGKQINQELITIDTGN
jgi:DNA mismatch repair protein MutL